MAKRKKADDEGEGDGELAATPGKSRRTTANIASSPADTPSRRSALRREPSTTDALPNAEATPQSLRRVLFSTPQKPLDQDSPTNGTPTAVRNANSARRKSAKALQRQAAQDEDESDDGQDDEIVLAQTILGNGEDEGDGVDAADAEDAAPSTATTPRRRGRPKGRRRERTPSPPPDLPPHELYFVHHRTGGNKTSANTLPPHLLLSHDDYFAQINAYKDPHQDDMAALNSLHHRAFDQWIFEMEEGFNLCLYGYGSKRALAMEFADHLHKEAETTPSIVVVNGYTPGLTMRDILSVVSSVVLPKQTKVPAQPIAALDAILSHLTSEPTSPAVTLIIHALDHPNLRRAGTQALLARLASHPRLSLLATCDTPNFALLWDAGQLRQFRWLYHDATTFAPYAAEIEVVEDVNALLGRSARRLGGKDGVAYVLRSLPENARTLFRILVAEQLALGADFEPGVGAEDDFDADSILGADDDDEAAAAAAQNTPSRRGRGKKAKKAAAATTTATAPEGVEYRSLYHKAVEEFVCSSEVNFRTLLKEFHDHQMIESRKDGMGTERLVVPFRREDLEAVLEELV